MELAAGRQNVFHSECHTKWIYTVNPVPEAVVDEYPVATSWWGIHQTQGSTLIVQNIAKPGLESGVTNWAGGYSCREMSKMQEIDPYLGKVIGWFKKSKQRPSRDQVAAKSAAVRHLWLRWEQLKLIGGVLHTFWESTTKGAHCFQLVVPEVMQCDILEYVHNSTTSGHLGLKNTYSKIQKRYHWFNMKATVHEWIRNCAKCGAGKKHPGHREHP